MTEDRKRVDRYSAELLERRQRSQANIDGGKRSKLAIPRHVEERLKEEGRTARWVEKSPNRMYALTQDDTYDMVDGVDPVITRSLQDGSPMTLVLVSKPTEFIQEDKAKLEEVRRTREAALEGGVTGEATAGQGGFYADKANSIKKAGRTA